MNGLKEWSYDYFICWRGEPPLDHLKEITGAIGRTVLRQPDDAASLPIGQFRDLVRARLETDCHSLIVLMSPDLPAERIKQTFPLIRTYLWDGGYGSRRMHVVRPGSRYAGDGGKDFHYLDLSSIDRPKARRREIHDYIVGSDLARSRISPESFFGSLWAIDLALQGGVEAVEHAIAERDKT